MGWGGRVSMGSGSWTLAPRLHLLQSWQNMFKYLTASTFLSSGSLGTLHKLTSPRPMVNLQWFGVRGKSQHFCITSKPQDLLHIRLWSPINGRNPTQMVVTEYHSTFPVTFFTDNCLHNNDKKVDIKIFRSIKSCTIVQFKGFRVFLGLCKWSNLRVLHQHKKKCLSH